jgi:hypothetical protein
LRENAREGFSHVVVGVCYPELRGLLLILHKNELLRIALRGDTNKGYYSRRYNAYGACAAAYLYNLDTMKKCHVLSFL